MSISYLTGIRRKLAQFPLECARPPGNEKLNDKCYLKMFRNVIEGYDLVDDLNL